MSRDRKAQEEPKPGVPAFIVTYSDMITLLLTFFVMLLSLAREQVDKHKFMVGRKSVQQALAQIGLSGALLEAGSGPELEFPKEKFKTPQEEDKKDDHIDTKAKDAQQEMLRRIVMDIERMMRVSPSQLAGENKIFRATSIRFPDGAWTLDQNAKNEIIDYVSQIYETLTDDSALFYVVGLANSEPGRNQKWTVSAKRSQAVAEFLKSRLSKYGNWPVYSWGAGDGGDWADETGLITKEAQIMIAVIIE